MCELFAYSSSEPTRARFSLEEFRTHGCAKGPHCDGWGLAFYQDKFAQIYRDEQPAAYSEWMAFLLNHEHHSCCVISHIRKATQGGVSLQNTQPYSRESGGARHVFAHNGNLQGFKEACTFARFEPIGDTDSEYAFCMLMDALQQRGGDVVLSLAQRIDVLAELFSQWSLLGPANIIYSDGEYLYAFANRRTQLDGGMRPPGLYCLTRDGAVHRHMNELVGVELEGCPERITLVASVPLSRENWRPFAENELIVCKAGQRVAQLTL